MLRHRPRGGMTPANRSHGAPKAAVRHPVLRLPLVILALAAALALLLSGSVNTAQAQQTPQTLVSNTSQSLSAALGSTGSWDLAQDFTTGTNPGGYVLSSIELHLTTGFNGIPSTLELRRGGPAGTLVQTLNGPATWPMDHLGILTFTTGDEVKLDPGTTYALVLSGASNSWNPTTSPAQSGLSGWTIGNSALRRAKGTSSSFNSYLTGSHVLRVNGWPSPPFNEEPSATSGDFPGSPRNGGTTDGIVQVGETSTGNLTAGVDSALEDVSDGLLGDYWRLDVTPGRSYRVELSAGGTDNLRGGSLGVGFTEQGSDDVSGYGAGDHFRDDGYAWADFTVGTRDWNRRYFARVAAWDFRSRANDPRIYNGSYEITLTDITGVELVFDNTYGMAGTSDQTITKSGDLDSRGGTTIGRRYGIHVRTGSHAEGYIIDRIDFLVTGEGEGTKTPFAELYSGNSGPAHDATPICATQTPLNFGDGAPFSSTTVYSVRLPAPDCADNTLSANTDYFLVFHVGFHGADTELSLTNATTSYSYGSGWTKAATGQLHQGALTASWSALDSEVEPRFKIWAKKVVADQNRQNFEPQGVPRVSGTAQAGQTLTADASTITDANGLNTAAFTYQWKRKEFGAADETGVNIGTGQTHTLTSAEAGKAVWVIVTYTDDDGFTHSVPSNYYLVVPEIDHGQGGEGKDSEQGDSPPPNTPATGEPDIEGTAKVGRVLTAVTSDIADADGLDGATFSYQWKRHNPGSVGGENIPGATGQTYTLTARDLTKAVSVTVTFTDDRGAGESLTSQATDAVTFDAGEDQRVLASALIKTGNEGRKNDGNQDRAWYATDTDDWHASGELLDGSLAWNDTTLTRVVYFADTGIFRFNDPRDAFDLGDSFAEGQPNHDLTIWIRTEDGTVSFKAKDHIVNHGGHWINFRAPQEIRATLDAIAEGDEIIVAVSLPTDP